MSTIKQIAQRAGVSPTTVSNVIHGKTSKVSPVIREKIEAILEEENYAPNMAANILAHNSSRIVSIIVFSEPRKGETPWEDPFSATILGHIEVELRKHNYFMMVHTTSDKDEILRLAKSWKLAGIILLWVPESVISLLDNSVECPVVHIDSYDLNEKPNYMRVGLDDVRGGYELTKYLLNMGHSNILYISNYTDLNGADYQRFIGCKNALEEAGLTFPNNRFVPAPKDKKERLALYSHIIQKPLLYTVLVFGADYYAVEAITYFQELGLGIPGDISITGWDDNLFSQIVTPKLTTVHQDTGEKGRIAVEMLIKAMRGEVLEELFVNLPARLVIRDSVCNLN